MSINNDHLIAKRDKRLHQTFDDLAPLWLINDEYRSSKVSFFFNVIFQHPVHGWISQHARYDTFNNVLYHLGQARMSEADVLQIQDQDPYISGSGAASIPNNPANRL